MADALAPARQGVGGSSSFGEQLELKGPDDNQGLLGHEVVVLTDVSKEAGLNISALASQQCFTELTRAGEDTGGSEQGITLIGRSLFSNQEATPEMVAARQQELHDADEEMERVFQAILSFRKEDMSLFQAAQYYLGSLSGGLVANQIQLGQLHASGTDAEELPELLTPTPQHAQRGFVFPGVVSSGGSTATTPQASTEGLSLEALSLGGTPSDVPMDEEATPQVEVKPFPISETSDDNEPLVEWDGESVLPLYDMVARELYETDDMDSVAADMEARRIVALVTSVSNQDLNAALDSRTPLSSLSQVSMSTMSTNTSANISVAASPLLPGSRRDSRSHSPVLHPFLQSDLQQRLMNLSEEQS